MDSKKWPLSLLGLHLLMLVYSFAAVLSKSAAAEPVLSGRFIVFYTGMLLILVVYALAWQRVIKHLPLSFAFANKAVTVVWGMLWGAMLFGEELTPLMIIGAVMIVSGIVLYSLAEGNDQP